MDEYPKKEWLEEAILEYVEKNEGVDSVDIVSHFKLQCDITLMSLKSLVDDDKIIETQPYMKFEYRLNKKQHCERLDGLDVCDREEDGTGTCGDKFDGCTWARKTKDGMNDRQSKGN